MGEVALYHPSQLQPSHLHSNPSINTQPPFVLSLEPETLFPEPETLKRDTRDEGSAFLGSSMQGYLRKGIQTPMARGWST